MEFAAKSRHAAVAVAVFTATAALVFFGTGLAALAAHVAGTPTGAVFCT